jgi:hypothetical protein
LKSVAFRSTEEGKITSAKQVISTNCFTTDQARRIVEVFTTEEARHEMAVYAYPFVLDRGSYFKMNGVFAEEASIDKMNQAILGQ